MKPITLLHRSLPVLFRLSTAFCLAALVGPLVGPAAADSAAVTGAAATGVGVGVGSGPIRLVTDFESQAKDFGSNLESTITAENQVFFVATDPTRGEELWRSDGTEPGTRIVADLNPGRQGSSLTPLGTIGDQLIFRRSREIWVSDGTDAGTRYLAELCTGCFSNLQPGISLSNGKLGGKVLFRVEHRTDGGFLWVSDGTPEGTGPLPGVAFPRFVRTQFGLVAPNTAVFPVREKDYSVALWQSDGTPEGTYPYHSMCEGCQVSSDFMTSVNGRVFLTVSSSATGSEPWITDGTSEGTQMLIDSNPGPAGNYDYNWLEYEGTFYGLLFDCPDLCIVATDGTPEGTRFALELYPNVEGLKPIQMQKVGSDLVMSFDNQTEDRYELWNVSGPDHVLLQTSPWLRLFDVEVDGRAVYAARSNDDKSSGRGNKSSGKGVLSPIRTWSTDGNSVQLLADVELSEPAVLDTSVIFNGTAPFVDGISESEPWISDGTPAGTQELREIHPPTTDSNPTGLLAWGSDLVFWTEEERGPDFPRPRQLWRSNGETSTLMRDDSDPWATAVAGGRLYATDFDNEWIDVFEPDGDVNSIDIGQLPWDMVAVGRRMMISGARVDQPLWISQGTQPQTQQIADIQPGWRPPCPPILCFPILDGYPDQLTALGRQVLFVAFEDDERSQLWTSRGEVGDAELLAEFEPDPDVPFFVESPHPEQITVAGGQAFFTAFDLPTGRELWITDGTPSGSRLLADLTPGSESSDIRHLTAWGSRTVFALGTETGDQLWLAKNQAQRLLNLGPDAQIHQIVASDVGLFLVVSTPEQGRELHVFNRQSAQPHRVFDLRPGMRGSGVSDITPVSGGIFFAADDGQGSGHEPWFSDGTLEGTHLIADLNPGPAASSPGPGLQIGDTVYFDADTAATGRELFALDLP